jgi:putative endopeptidase
MNYGALGTAIAHELSHGEDDLGMNYDAEGKLRDWWLPPAAREFENRAKCYVSLYDKYKPAGLDVNVNGSLTLGENLADGNGIKISFTAFRNALASVERAAAQTQGKNTSSSHVVNERPKNALLARELTNNQLFFVSWAQLWCRLDREEMLRNNIANDGHSPAPFRVEGPLSQMKEFASSFHCKQGSKYNPPRRCYLWDV